ncbi:MAG: hypothetical protein DMD82_13085 [Candidatus Rokuibacteriota bacterium]|nr:MAG: hypothetical protein DMD82_13085 [Candidatus Rokubacteria bacterium]
MIGKRTSLSLVVIALLPAVPALAASGTPVLLFQALKAGQWAQLEGTPQKDHTVLCSEAKILAGDFLEEDCHVRGVVRGIDTRRRRIYVHRLGIQPKDQVEYESENGTLNDFPDIKLGMLISVEGTYANDGTFLATELEDESEKLTRKPEWETKIQFVGRVEKLDAVKRTIRLMGTAFVVTDGTRVKSVLK